jgi:hypothetical protein
VVIQHTATSWRAEPVRTHVPLREPLRTLPFVVVGDVGGREELGQVGTPAEALELMLRWLRVDEDARAVWYLREDWPEGVTVIGRPAPGHVGETRRATHLFRIEPGAVQCGALVAHCGTELTLPQIEWVRLGAGMPCETCLAATRPPTAPSPRPGLEG